jgi:maltooligosyltrehalose trehalohydrolase
MREWTASLGAVAGPHGTTFRVWAPAHERVELVLQGSAEQVAEGDFSSGVTPDIRPLVRDRDGYWSEAYADIPTGTLYRYRVEGDEARTYPDPASRFQPLGVHGPSQVIDPASFAWTDAEWKSHPIHELVFYELHVGTFTPDGTFRGVIDRLPYLQRLGVTALELMPVADFPGGRNWGYDGVSLYAPSRAYGTPNDLRALVDAAHAHRLGVCLDVVYNHLGPDGAYANAFSPYYFSNRHPSPWGPGVNLDGPQSGPVRRFFIENAIHWVREYHVDALRLDATHALCDDGEVHFLAELTQEVHAQAGREVVLIAEDHRNLTSLAEPVQAGGFGLDAVWADDFHHQVRVHTAGEREGYYVDYSGTAADVAETLRQGWFFRGQPSLYFAAPRGTDPFALALQQFVVCIQNHDQIGNRADGARLNHEIDPAVYRAVSTLLLLAPEVPLLFMGQEWAASSPFLYFTDHHEELGREVTAGRRNEFRAFASFRDPEQRAAIPDPQALDTFMRSRLCWDEVEQPPHAGVHRLYERLLALRRDIRPAAREDINAIAIDSHTVAVSLHATRGRHARLVVARLSGGAAEVCWPVDDAAAMASLLTTEDADLVDDAMPIQIESSAQLGLRFARPGAIVLAPLLLPAT